MLPATRIPIPTLRLRPTQISRGGARSGGGTVQVSPRRYATIPPQKPGVGIKEEGTANNKMYNKDGTNPNKNIMCVFLLLLLLLLLLVLAC